MYEYVWIIIDRVLNMAHTVHRVRSLYSLMSTYWEMGVLTKNPVSGLK